MGDVHPDVTKVLYSADDIDARVSELAARINVDYAGKKLLVVTILKGACVFMADLARKLDVDLELSFMVVSSYGSAAHSSGTVEIVQDIDRDVAGLDLLIVEDILDTGLTIRSLVAVLAARGPASVEAAVLLRKDLGNESVFEPKYLGFTCPNEFIVGYGLDYAQRYRNLPYIGVLDERVYA